MDGRTTRPMRPRSCEACQHPDRVRIEFLRLSGASVRSLQKQFGVSKDIILRHVRNHMSPQRKAELVAGPAAVAGLAEAAADESKSLLDYLAITRSVLFNQFIAAAEAGDRTGVSSIAGRLLACLTEVGRLTGELRQLSGVSITNNTVNFIGSAEFAQLSEGLLGISRRHPEVRAEIIDLLRGLDAGSSPPKPNGAGQQMLIEGEVHVA
jgi:hypothetical protein